MGAWARPGAGGIGGWVGIALAAGLLAPGPAASDDLSAPVPGTLPLAIRDGRIAELSVHIVPFDILADKPGAATAAALDRLVATIATDCFLTAQAIGHVRPGIPGDGETLASHRLARARSETVQAALIRGGLPAASVASVWDYQFIVREPRVTLWIFQLPVGDECTGAPLPSGAAAPAVASLSPAAEPVTPAAQEPYVHPPSVSVAETEAEVGGDASAPSAATEAVPPIQLPAAPATPPPGQLSARLADPPEPGAAPTAHAAPAAPVARAEIVFDENSSFFPRGADAELRRLVAALPAGHGYEFEVAAAVDDKAGRGDDPQTALAYNRWLADRRQGRVAEWLEQHAEIRVVEVRRSLLEHDPSRRVVIRARPLP